MGGDDLAAFYDVITAGHRLVYEPAAIVLHRHHRDYAGLRRQTYGYGAGLGAYLTRCLLRDPRAALALLRHAPAAAPPGPADPHPAGRHRPAALPARPQPAAAARAGVRSVALPAQPPPRPREAVRTR